MDFAAQIKEKIEVVCQALLQDPIHEQMVDPSLPRSRRRKWQKGKPDRDSKGQAEMHLRMNSETFELLMRKEGLL